MESIIKQMGRNQSFSHELIRDAMKIQCSKKWAMNIIDDAPSWHVHIHDVSPEKEDFYELNEYIDYLRMDLNLEKDVLYGKIIFEYVLTSPDVNIKDFDSYGSNPKEHYKDMIIYIYSKLWPDSTLPTTPPDVELIDMDVDEWRKTRHELNPHIPEDAPPIPDRGLRPNAT